MSIFTKTAVERRPTSTFGMSHEWKGSMNMGYLIPIDTFEVLPNDTIVGNTEAYIQFAPMTYPVMHRIDCKIYHFFVPNRILWKYWEKFIYDSKDPSRFPKPYVNFFNDLGRYGQLTNGTLSDYIGLPVAQFLRNEPQDYNIDPSFDQPIDIMPFIAYQKIWNDYFRDENLQDDLFEEDDLLNPESLHFEYFENRGYVPFSHLRDAFVVRKKAWEKDYFTSALPEPFYGEPVPVNVVGNASINLLPQNSPLRLYTPQYVDGLTDEQRILVGLGANQVSTGWKEMTAGAVGIDGSDNSISYSYPHNQTVVVGRTTNNGIVPVNIDGLQFTISDLRLASAIQRMQEALARAGHRYKEAMITMYNQVTPDFRLERPEFIAASNIPVVVSAVAQTSETSQDSPQGLLAGRASVMGSNNNFRYHAQEHGWFLTLACVIPRTCYANGLHRQFTRFDRYDYHNPYFEEIGDQAIKNKEVYMDYDNPDNNDNDFGYAPRYSEYKDRVSTVHGDFLDTLDFMTLTRLFNDVVNLNEDFITPDNVTTDRAFSVYEVEGRKPLHHLYCQFYNKLKMRRKMKANPIPKLM